MITADQVLASDFHAVIRGYRCKEVDQFLDEVAEALRGFESGDGADLQPSDIRGRKLPVAARGYRRDEVDGLLEGAAETLEAFRSSPRGAQAIRPRQLIDIRLRPPEYRLHESRDASYMITPDEPSHVLTAGWIKTENSIAWQFKDHRKDTSMRDADGAVAAEATLCSTRPDEWRIVEPGQAYTLTLTGGTHGYGYRVGVLSYEGDAVSRLASVTLQYTVQRFPRHGFLKGGSFDCRGMFDGNARVYRPVSPAALLFAIRLTLGVWAKRPPRVGEWVERPDTSV